jgi:hypothetical protein
LILKKFEKEIVFESSVLAWIRNRIRIEQKCWFRIRIKSIRIHNPDYKVPVHSIDACSTGTGKKFFGAGNGSVNPDKFGSKIFVSFGILNLAKYLHIRLSWVTGTAVLF